MFLRRIACSWVALGLVASLASGAEAEGQGKQGTVVIVRAFDAVTKAQLPRIQTALADPVTHKMLAHSESGVLRLSALPGTASRLFVYLRGYDLVERELAQGVVRADVILRPIQRPCVLVVSGPGMEKETFRLSVVGDMGRRNASGWPRDLIADSFDLDFKGPRVSLPVARGLHFTTMVQVGSGVVWPIGLRLRPGRTHQLHYRTPWTVRLRPSGVRNVLARDAFEFVPDRMWQPREMSRDRVDAWRWMLNGPMWLSQLFPPAGDSMAVTPRVAFHLWIDHGGVPIYRHLAPPSPAEPAQPAQPANPGDCAESVLDLRPPYRAVAIVERPLLDGNPIPGGTLLASGRLDLQALAMIWDQRERLPGFTFRAPGRAAAWPQLRLADAAWLTLWHPDLGLAHMAWPQETKRAPGRSRPLNAKTYRARLRVTAAAGGLFSGSLYFYPVWSGAGAVSTVPPAGILLHRFGPTVRLIYRGLRPGRYGIECKVRFLENARAGGADSALKRRHGEFLVTAGGGEAAFILAAE